MEIDPNDPVRSPLLEKFVMGSSQNAYLGSKLAVDYDKMRNRKEDSAARRVGGDKHLVPGGPVSVGLCRDIDERQLAEEKKAKERREWRKVKEAILKRHRQWGELFWDSLKMSGKAYVKRANQRNQRQNKR